MSRVAIVVGEGYEDAEFDVPRQCLQDAGHDIDIIGSHSGSTVHGKKGNSEVQIEKSASEAHAEDYSALVIPGGFGPDRLRADSTVVHFVKDCVDQGMPIAAICHGPQLLIEAGTLKGVTLTSWPSIRTDLLNAGAQWVDEPVVEDGTLITSRKPDDLNVFCDALLKRLPTEQREQAR